MTAKKIVAYVFIGLVVLSVVVAFLYGGARGAGSVDFSSGRSIVVLHLTGTIQDGGGGSLFSGGGISPDSVRRQLRQAERSGRVAAVVLRMNTGGGTVAASQEIARIVDEFDADKPIVVSMGDTTASGGYYIASQADRIVAQPGTLTGSIGVIWTTFDYAGLLDKVGVKIETITAGKHKDMFLPGRMTPERRVIVQELVDDSYEQFIDAVVDGRGLTDASVRSLATGQLYTGEQAFKLRLVDELGGLEKAIKEAERLAGIENAQIIEPTPSIWDAFFGGPGINSLSETVGSFLIGPDILMLREFLNSYPALRY